MSSGGPALSHLNQSNKINREVSSGSDSSSSAVIPTSLNITSDALISCEDWSLDCKLDFMF